MRQTLILAHRWTALIAGIVLLVVSASGAALVFEGAIDRGLHPELWRAAGPAEITGPLSPLPIDSLVSLVRARFPNATVGSVGIAPVPGRAWTFNAGPQTVFVNPYSGAINGTRTPQEQQATLARRLHVLHVEVLAGHVGRELVGAVTIVGFFLVLTGIILWWPDKLIRVTATASWKRVNFDLHHALGIIAAPILIVITASGLVIHYEVLTNAVRALDAAPPTRPPVQPAGPADAPRLSFDSIAAHARTALPGAAILSISAGGGKSPAVAAMRFPEDRTPGGRSRIFFDRYTGAVLLKVSTREAPIGTRIDNLKRSLHTGDIFGKPSAALWLLAALVMASQMVTGTLMWWNARKARR